MQNLHTLTLTLMAYLAIGAAVVAYFWGVSGPPAVHVATLLSLLLCLGGVLCAWLCFAASTSRPSPVAFALGCGLAAATGSYAIAAAMSAHPAPGGGRIPPPWSWTIPLSAGLLLTLVVQRHSKLRLRHELGISIFFAFAVGCVFAYISDVLLARPQFQWPRLPYVVSGVVALFSAALVIGRAREDAFRVSVGTAILLLGTAAVSAVEAFAPRGFAVFATAGLLFLLGIIPVNFCFEALRAIRAQAAQSGEFDPAIRDALTSLYNRRALDTMGRELHRQTLRADRPVSVLMFDIDHFKQVNDLHGHAAGDVMLAGVAAVISQHVRTTDFVARYGGEEFAVILPGAPLAPAMRLAERIRLAVEQTEVSHDSKTLRATTSIGAATAFPGEAGDFRSLLDAADKNLYRAKRAGRNQVITAPLHEEEK